MLQRNRHQNNINDTVSVNTIKVIEFLLTSTLKSIILLIIDFFCKSRYNQRRNSC